MAKSSPITLLGMKMQDLIDKGKGADDPEVKALQMKIAETQKSLGFTDAVQARMDGWQDMTPAQRQKVDDIQSGWNAQSPAQRQKVADIQSGWNAQSPAQRAKVEEIRAQRGPQERIQGTPMDVQNMRDLAAAEKMFGAYEVPRDVMASGSAALKANSSTQAAPTGDVGGARAMAATDDARLSRLFKTVTGSTLDMKSKADTRKMDQLRMFLEENPDMADMSDNKIALAFYRKGK